MPYGGAEEYLEILAGEVGRRTAPCVYGANLFAEVERYAMQAPSIAPESRTT